MLKKEPLDEEKLGGAKEALSTYELLLSDSNYFTGDNLTIVGRPTIPPTNRRNPTHCIDFVTFQIFLSCHL